MSRPVPSVVPSAGAIPQSLIQKFRRWLTQGRNDKRVIAKAVAQLPTAHKHTDLVAQLYAAVGTFRAEHKRRPCSTHGWTEMVCRAAEEGFTLLGSGYFSAAFSHPDAPGIAFKFGFKAEDSGAAYAAWARQNQGRPLVPVIHALHRRSSGYVVVMKQYVSIYKATDRDRVDEVHDDLVAVVEYGLKPGARRRNRTIGLYLGDEQYKVARDIHRHFVDIAEFDLHADNVMLDADTQEIVITDPVSFNPGVQVILGAV